MSKVLCLYCDEKYIPGHNCSNKHQVMLLPEGGEEDSTVRSNELSIIWKDEVCNTENAPAKG